MSGGSADDPRLARRPSRVSLANACTLSRVRPWRRLSSSRFAHLRVELRPELAEQLVDVDARVPDVEVAHAANCAHRARGTRRRVSSTTASLRCRSRTRCRAPAISMLAARRLTSHSHGPGQRLVEVVDVEHQSPLGRREQPEVREVGVAAALHGQARARRGGQVGGHDQRRAPDRSVNGDTSIRP